MPANKVGGDYYDFLRLQNKAWAIAIGDVSGKGVAAALVMANLQASLRAQALHAQTLKRLSYLNNFQPHDLLSGMT